jgi:hypothetical protein
VDDHAERQQSIEGNGMKKLKIRVVQSMAIDTDENSETHGLEIPTNHMIQTKRGKKRWKDLTVVRKSTDPRIVIVDRPK